MLPVLFLSHGSPSMILEEDPARTVLLSLAEQLPEPRAVLCISPHWQTADVALSTADRPETIHDFYGFPRALYQIQYPVAGEPELAAEVRQQLQEQGVMAKLVERGLDHGAWTPLMLLWPDAGIPVLGMSLPAHQSPQQLYQLGQKLSRLRQQGVMIIASGSASHNLAAMAAPGTAPEPWAREFQDWLTARLQSNQLSQLLNWQTLAPHARKAHPTTEHLEPLFIALGAAAGAAPEILYQGYSYGNLGMLHLVFAGS